MGGLAAYGSFVSFPFNHWVFLLLAAASTACVTAGGNVLNDILDRESDRTNHPDRPLVTGSISVGSAKTLAVGLFVASGALVVPVIPQAFLVGVILAVALAALLTYEFRFKSLGLAGNLLVAFLTGAVFLYGGAAVGDVVVVVPFALMAFFATLSREVIKDMEDVAGDIDRRTLPQTHGMATATWLARGSVVVALALSPIPVLTFLRGSPSVAIIYLALVLAADALFVVSVLWLPKQLHREQTLSKGAMTVALLAFLATAFR